MDQKKNLWVHTKYNNSLAIQLQLGLDKTEGSIN